MKENQHNNYRKNAHAVIIGIDRYLDQNITDLHFAKADAEGVYQVLTDPELGRFSPDNVTLLMNEQATQRNIRSAIGTQIPRRAGEKDLVYIYYAGHGSPVINPNSRSSDGMEKYLVPTDAELNDLRATGISMDEILKFFGWIESKQVIFFIDSCYSGAAGGRTFQHPRFQGRHMLTNEFLDELASEGRLVVTACDVNEVSLESPDLGHGIFTHYLIEGLKGVADKDRDSLVTMNELYEYVYEQVSQHARGLGGSMHPIQKGSLQGKIYLTGYATDQPDSLSPDSALSDASTEKRIEEYLKQHTKTDGSLLRAESEKKPKTKAQPIESIDDLKKHFFSKFWLWLNKKSLAVKISLGVTVIVVLFVLARVNVFGDPFYKLTRYVLPSQIAGIDPEVPVIPLSMNFEITDKFGRRQAKVGEAYFSGDSIHLSIAADLRCWVTVFCVDSKGTQKVFQNSFDPSLIEPDKTYRLDFELDETVGAEIYYAIAAAEKFSFDEDIKPNLDNLFPEGHSKGPKFSQYELKLPSRFVQRQIYFNHLSRQ